MRILCCCLALAVWGVPVVPAAELLTLAPANWDAAVPQGKEVDAIYGDYVLRSDQLVLVVGRPGAERHANLTVKSVGGALIDLTRAAGPNDQLSAYFPGASRYAFQEAGQVTAWTTNPEQVQPGPDPHVSGPQVSLQCAAEPVAGRPRVWVRYTLADGAPFVVVESIYKNEGTEPLVEELADAIRADRLFEFGQDAETGLLWAYDEWFGQAYGVVVEGFEIKRDKLLQLQRDGQSQVKLAPGETLIVRRRIFPGDHLLAVRATARTLRGLPLRPVEFTVTDPAGPVAHAKVTLRQGKVVYGAARTTAAGNVVSELPPVAFEVTVEALGRPPVTVPLAADATGPTKVELAACGYVVGQVTDAAGNPLPCKVAFYDERQPFSYPLDKEGKYDPRAGQPYFGPDAGEFAVHNLVYAPQGKFRQEMPPGKYDAVVTYGPEYNAAFVKLDVRPGVDTLLVAKLPRVVDTAGWVSSDFHSHSSPSGDNVSSQLGRVLNLLCEHIEFAPCTEHARVDTYDPHLRRLGVERLLATCPGMELTGAPLPINHQNAFPLVLKPRTQNGGGPTTDVNPVTQIERLALWDDKSDKLVQQNHPNLQQILRDKDLDGQPDGGFSRMLSFMDVVEIHPPAEIFSAEKPAKPGTNTMRQWLRLLNLGYRIPGVVNTDAHYNFHGSGWLRNYLRSPTDDPARLRPLDIAHAAEAGHVVVTNGPFLEVEAVADEPRERPARGIPGDTVVAPQGKIQLRIRVQCANWYDVNRVQVFANGRAVPELNFTRREHPERFADGVLKFSAHLPLTFDRDTHLVIATAGEGLTLGHFYGPVYGKAMPVAVSNPIFLDRDGDGFQANGDMLDLP
ncbi:MAG: CehA/McbA family metallohydrolase [Pirellulales bacterium]